MDQARKIKTIITPQPVMEGAGVLLKRSIATRTLGELDPFLLFDHFGSDNPEDYLAGFPMHPHRGIETVTYMLAGTVRHRDTLGNAGTIGPGDLQWMTSGRGILHEEMPQRSARLDGFQLWVNLPARLKMTAPRYQDISAAKIPVWTGENGVTIRVIAGEVGAVRGPVTDIAAAPTYLDVTVPANGEFRRSIPRGHAAFVYLFEGAGTFGIAEGTGGAAASAPSMLILDDGDVIAARAGESGARFLVVSGRPLNEPIARYGPFVMNTREEIEETLRELREGTFIR
ncbi:MAG: pirin family protein [Candidatus Manganitrophaceae bacterium]|nr:MAG: pirin family protein [Candidatus Manganitrophaceae bacterium]